MSNKKAVIFGVTGQDGSYLSELLLMKGYHVIGITRRCSVDNTERLKCVLSNPNFLLKEGDISDYSSVSGILNPILKNPHTEIYNLSAQSHVGTSFSQPLYTLRTNTEGVFNILETIIHSDSPLTTKLYQACHDIETKVITPNGIKNYKDLNIGDLVYTINEKTKKIELKEIKNIFEYDYNDNLINIESKRISQFITPNHKVLLTNDNDILTSNHADLIKNLFKYDSISNYSLPTGKHYGTKTNKILLEKSINNNYKNIIDSINANDYAILLGLYIGDGYIKKSFYYKSEFDRKERQKFRDKTGKFIILNNTRYIKNEKYTSRIEWAIPKDDKARPLICQLLKNIGLDFNMNDTIVWCSCYGLAKKLGDDAGHYFNNKRIPEYIYEYDRKFLENLLRGLLFSDGDAKRQYFTSNENLAIDIIRLIFSLGYYPSLNIRKQKPSFSKKLNRIIQPNNSGYIIGIGYSGKNKIYRSNISEKYYSGKVWCLEIKDNSNFLVIRNGKIAFSGNSTSEMFGDMVSSKWKSSVGFAPAVCIDHAHVKDFAKERYSFLYQDENTPFNPQSPYAIAKLAAHQAISLYRNSYNTYACAGILFNHESPRRGEKFVTRKITKYIAKLVHYFKYNPYAPPLEKLKLGNLDAMRDWGYAPDYVEAMWLMLQQIDPKDYVIGTGETHTVRDFCIEAFNTVGLDWDKFVEIDEDLKRPSEVPLLKADSSKAKKELGWTPSITFKELVNIMVNEEIINYGKICGIA